MSRNEMVSLNHSLAEEDVIDRRFSDVFDAERDRREIEHAAYREAAERSMRLFNASLAQLGGRLLVPKAKLDDVTVDFWTVAYAVGSFLCEGVSMSRRAIMLGIERATLSANVVRFAVGNDLPPSEFMRQDPDTMRIYMEARTRAIEQENGRL